MVWSLMKDKKKPVDIYAQGTATAKAQGNYPSVTETAQKFNNLLVKPLTTPFVNAATPAIERVKRDAKRQGMTESEKVAEQNNVFGSPQVELQRASGVSPQRLSASTPFLNGNAGPANTAREIINGNRADRQGSPTAVRRVGGNMMAESLPIKGQTVFQSGNVGADGSGKIAVNLSDRDKQIKSVMDTINQRLAGGEKVSPQQMQKIQQLRQQAGFARGGTDRVPVGLDGLPLRSTSGPQRVGNLDVTFDNSVSPQQRREFLTPSPFAQSQLNLARPEVTTRTPDGYFVTQTGQSINDVDNINSGRKFALDAIEAGKTVKTNNDIELQKLKNQGAVEAAKAGKAGPKLYKKTTYDKLGNPTGEEFIDENGNPVGSDGSYQMQAPQSAIDALAKDPKLAEQFKQKYGYLPAGF